jgi:hypothetical protein
MDRERKKIWVVQCKITDTMHRRLEVLREEYGFRSVYEIIQALVSVFIRNASAPVTETGVEADEMRKVLEGFETEGGRMKIAGSEQEQKKEVAGGVVFMTEKDKNQIMCKTVEEGEDGGLVTDLASCTAIDTVIKYADRRLYDRLRQISAHLREERMDRVIDEIARDWLKDREDRECASEFDDLSVQTYVEGYR